MSLLNRIDAIEDALKSILEVLEQNKEKLDRLLAKKVEKDWSLLEGASEQPTVVEKTIIKGGTIEPKEEVALEQDLVGVLLMNETEKAFLVVKHGFQVWVAKSHLEDATGYDLGNRYDLKVKEKSKWILKKLDWKPFTVVKN